MSRLQGCSRVFSIRQLAVLPSSTCSVIVLAWPKGRSVAADPQWTLGYIVRTYWNFHFMSFQFSCLQLSVFIDATKMNCTEKRVQLKDATATTTTTINCSLSAIFGLAACVCVFMCECKRCLWDFVDVPWDILLFVCLFVRLFVRLFVVVLSFLCESLASRTKSKPTCPISAHCALVMSNKLPATCEKLAGERVDSSVPAP